MEQSADVEALFSTADKVVVDPDGQEDGKGRKTREYIGRQLPVGSGKEEKRK